MNTRKLKLLDLYCCQGGAGMGYHRAGFDVTGVDIEPQPRYPFAFIRGDALEYVAEHGHEYDAIHASPPCQSHSVIKNVYVNDKKYHSRHVDLISQTRDALIEVGRPYVIENVEGAPLINPVILCGLMFGLKVYRHRLFETSFFMLMPPHVAHKDKTPAAGRGKSPKGFISVCGNGGAANLGMPYLDYASMAMDIDWMNRPGISQAIPPAYTQYIGAYLLEAIGVTA